MLGNAIGTYKILLLQIQVSSLLSFILPGSFSVYYSKWEEKQLEFEN